MFKQSKSRHVDFKKVYSEAKHQLDKLPYIKKKKEKNFVFLVFKYVSIFILLAFVFFLIIFTINFNSLKNIYHNISTGKDSVEASVYSIKNRDYESAYKASLSANANFVKASEEISSYKNKVYSKFVPGLVGQIEEVEYITETAVILSQAVLYASEFGENINKTINNDYRDFSSLTRDEKVSLLKFIHDDNGNVTDIVDQIKLANTKIKSVKGIGVMSFFSEDLNKLKSYINEADTFLSKTYPLIKVVPSLLGYPEQSSYLLILQNNDELRPTGGFIGTYGIMQVKDGDIARLDTHDIYHMDMPVKDLFLKEPPEPISDYLNKQWFMRDANWSPHWPTTAERLRWFYAEENKLLTGKNKINNFDEEFDGVIGITPDLIIDILKITGPIMLEGVEYSADNFQDVLQYRVEKGYVHHGESSWQRKEVIGDIVKELKVRMLNFGIADLYKTFDVITKHLDRKNILFSFSDDDLQEAVKTEKWAGMVDDIDIADDYLMVIDANMAAYKTDRVINRTIDYKVTQKVDGTYAELKINYAHNGDKYDWKTTTYRTFTRVFVPEGSELIRAGGFNNSEKIKTYEELGKTVFGVFLTVELKEIGGLYFYYKLPDNLHKNLNNDYNLIVQKQPGSDIEDFKISLDFVNAIKSYAPTGFNVIKENEAKINWDTDLMSDREFKIKF